MTARLFALALIATLAVGCNKPGSTPTPGAGSTKITPAVKRDLKKTVLKKGAPPRWNKNMKPSDFRDRMVVIYRGTLPDGKIFDSNDKEGDALMEFGLGEGGVIEGWDKGLVGMLPGDKVKLEIPAEMAYGKGGTDGIPPNTDLTFEILVVDVIKFGEEQLFAVMNPKVGSGPVATKGKTVTIRYRVERPDGVVVQDSFEEKKDLTFKVGAGEIIQGIDMGIEGMRQGGIREIYLPSRIGYRPQAEEGPNPYPTITKIELRSVK